MSRFQIKDNISNALINYVPSKRLNSLNFRSWCKGR
nr:MAG TPA: hypothetical protein [Caudoviricetes sp.]